MPLIGLTGGIGTGKSTVAEMLSEQGAYVIDFDVLSRIVVEPDKPAWQDIIDFFGKSVLNEDRTLNRVKLGDIVFDDEEKRRQLQGFIYPRLFEEYSRQVEEIRQKDPGAIIIVDVPLLIEIRLQHMFEKIIVVYAPEEQQLQRLIERDGLTQKDAVKRLEAQMPIEEKLNHADFVIRNTDSLEDTRTQVQQVLKQLQQLNIKDDSA
jgi:dephospho-CoA kinase